MTQDSLKSVSSLVASVFTNVSSQEEVDLRTQVLLDTFEAHKIRAVPGEVFYQGQGHVLMKGWRITMLPDSEIRTALCLSPRIPASFSFCAFADFDVGTALPAVALTADRPRAYTAEEVRKKFLDHIHGMVNYWERVKRDDSDAERTGESDLRRRLDGLAFSILVMIDGSTMDLPAFDLIPSPHEDDRAYHIAEDENWFPTDEVINDCMLHEEWYRGTLESRLEQLQAYQAALGRLLKTIDTRAEAFSADLKLVLGAAPEKR